MLSQYAYLQELLEKIPKKDQDGNPLMMVNPVEGQADIPVLHGRPLKRRAHSWLSSWERITKYFNL